MNSVYYFICEGKSEFAYIQEINRFFREECLPLYFKAYDAQGGTPTKVKIALKNILRENRHTPKIFALLDLDIYYREDANILDLPDNIIYLFNSWNFEDFLVMHFDDDICSKWYNSCCISGHSSLPEHSSVIIPRLQATIFPLYKKGDLPPNFIIDWNTLDNLFRHNSNNAKFLISDFAYFFKHTLINHYKSSKNMCSNSFFERI